MARPLAAAVAAAIGQGPELRVVESSGHYIGGEETAAVASVMGASPSPA
jgi:NADH-quinone oxidoreductase subunit F